MQAPTSPLGPARGGLASTLGGRRDKVCAGALAVGDVVDQAACADVVPVAHGTMPAPARWRRLGLAAERVLERRPDANDSPRTTLSIQALVHTGIASRCSSVAKYPRCRSIYVFAEDSLDPARYSPLVVATVRVRVSVLAREHPSRPYPESGTAEEPKGRIRMSGHEDVGSWRNVDIPDDMPVSRILRDYVANACGFDSYLSAGTQADPFDVIGLLWGAVLGLEARLADAQRQQETHG
ncbi:hypothetical protein MycrhN_5513 [Mycolicibacterium rhodesiae NBB3]|uniref:Uncharacterized protein n=1 Tax=Mycolicibacterium rhodesiae (strain NBB3) TaxID=710685 RepID=G8RJP1_MYCRN|nr:hypothetical protein MycrhN_5513 [Mycolicibacterium rhodesiae NBB3]